MNLSKIKLTIMGICGVLLIPLTSEASGATLVTPNAALFTIDFSFTDDLYDVQVPVAAEFGTTYLDRVDTVGYTIQSDSPNSPKIAEVNALVLSTEPISGNRYLLEKGKTGNFSLVILVTFAEEISDGYHAKITKLPYWLDARRTTVHQNQLDELDVPILK